MRPITKSVIRKMLRMKLRLIGISLVISMAMAMVIAGFYGADVMDHSISNLLEEGRMPDVFIEFSTMENQGDVAAVLDTTSSIRAYDLRLKLAGVYHYEGEVYHTIFIGITDPDNQAINRLELDTGRLFASSGEAIAIAGMESKGIQDGSHTEFELMAQTLDLSITGTVRSPEYIFSSAYTDYSIPFIGSLVVIYMPLDDLQSIAGSGINDAIILVNNQGDEENVIASLDEFSLQSVTFLESHPSVTFWNIGTAKLKSIFPLMGAIFMFIGFISIFMTMMRLVQNDSRYIGVLMSLGYYKKTITRTYLLLGLIISLIGCMFGVFIGLAFTQSFVQVGLSLYMSINAIILPFNPMPFLIGIFFTTVVVLLSVYLPVHIITRSSVREALEYKPRVRVHTSKIRTGNLSKITLLGIRNTTRNPKRLALTVIVVGLTISVAGSWLVMADSAFEYIGDQINADTWDLRVDFLNPIPLEEVNAPFLGLSPGEPSYLIPFSYITAEVGSTTDKEGAAIIGCDEMDRIRSFDINDGTLDFNNAVITNKMADDLNVGVGDTITILVGSLERNIKVSGIVSDIIAHSLYTSRENIAPFFPEDYSYGAYVKLNDAETTTEVAQSIRQSPSVSKVVAHADIFKTIDDIMELAVGFLYFFFFINLLIALVVAA
jgi:ABC-type lipoprotein release transport system permease subunit